MAAFWPWGWAAAVPHKGLQLDKFVMKLGQAEDVAAHWACVVLAAGDVFRVGHPGGVFTLNVFFASMSGRIAMTDQLSVYIILLLKFI